MLTYPEGSNKCFLQNAHIPILTSVRLSAPRIRNDPSTSSGTIGSYSSPILSAAINASCGMLTLPYSRIRALPFFCFSSSFFLRDMSPP